MGILQGLASENGKLYALWKGGPNDDQIYFSSRKLKGKWSAAKTMGGNTSVGSALTSSGGSIWAAWKGEWSDPRIFFAKLHGSSWGPQALIPNAFSEVGPALGTYGGNLVAAWKNAFDEGLYYAIYSKSNGVTSWSEPALIPGVASSVGPSLANLGGTLYAAWKGEGEDQGLYYASFDGTNWTGQNPIEGVASSVGPSLGVVGTNMYAVWKGSGTDQGLYYSVFDGMTWGAQANIPGVASSIGAAICDFNGDLYAMWKGSNTDVALYDAFYNGTKWSGQSKDIPGITGPDPTTLLSAPGGGQNNYYFSDSNGAALTGTTFTVTVTEDIIPDNGEDFGFQFNCDGPAQSSGPEAVVWQQYLFVATQNELCFLVNNWRQQDLGAGPFIQWDSRPKTSNTVYNGVVSLPYTDNRLPKGWQLTLTLLTDDNTNVTGFTFSIVQPDGTALNSPVITLLSLNLNAAYENLAPIQNCGAFLIKNNGGKTTDFSAGQGIFLCYETNNLVASLTPNGSAVQTGENSNIGYSSLPASYPNGEFYQLFGIGLAS